MVRQEMLASLLFRQHVEIPLERHPLFIVVKKGRDARRRGSVGPKKLWRFLRLPGSSQDKIHRLSSDRERTAYVTAVHCAAAAA